jgi:hypothetical protein
MLKNDLEPLRFELQARNSSDVRFSVIAHRVLHQCKSKREILVNCSQMRQSRTLETAKNMACVSPAGTTDGFQVWWERFAFQSLAEMR